MKHKCPALAILYHVLLYPGLLPDMTTLFNWIEVEDDVTWSPSQRNSSGYAEPPVCGRYGVTDRR